MKNSSVLTENSRFINSSISMINHSAVSSIIENDDVREKKSSKQAAKLSSNLNKSSSYVSSPSFGRRKQLKTSCMSNGLTHEQLKEIYSSCIRLSSENKINVKNAFGLQLIDYMQDLLTTNTDENNIGATTNFQVAGCTLDASVKIYSYRVDSVHSDAVKIAGTLGSEQITSGHNEDSAGQSDDSTNPDDGDTNDKRSKKHRNKKAKRHANRHLLSKLEKNLKNINLDQFCAKENETNNNHTLDYKGDENCFTFGHADSNPITSLLLNNFGPCSDKGDFTIDPSSCIFSNAKESLWNDSVCKCDPNALRDITTDLYDESGQFKSLNNLIGIVDNFKFMQWQKPINNSQQTNNSVLDNINVLTGIVDNDSDRSAIEKHRKTLLQSVLIDTAHTMDETLIHDQSGLASDHNETSPIDAPQIHDEPYFDNDDFPQQASAIEFEFPNKGEAVMSNNVSVATELTNMLSHVPMNMTGGLTLELSTEPGEYSYFKNLNNVRNNVSQIPNMWAGPEHWKHFSMSVVKGIGESTLDNRGSVISANLNANKVRQTRKRKQLNDNANFGSNALGMVCEVVDFSEPLSAEALRSLKTGKASSTFSKNILLPTNSTSITMLETDTVDIKPLFQLFLMPNIKLSQNFTDKDDNDAPIVTLQNGQIYDYNNDNDRLNYCSVMMDDVDDHKPFNDDYFNTYASGFPSPFKPSSRPSIFQDDKGGIFTGAATPMPMTGCINHKNKIDYARFAKRFDTRQIKSTLWNILKNDNDEPKNVNSPINSENQSPDDTEFVIDNKTSFDKVYNSLIDKLPSKSAQNVSVPIAIVCLLHLANEKNLSLEGNDLMDNIHIKLNECNSIK